MTYGLISDIHANIEAFDAVLEKLAGADAFLCMGDVVGYGPDPGPCIDRLRSLPNLTCIAGNHDLAAAGLTGLGRFNPHARHAIDWTMLQLSDDHRQYLARLRPAAYVEDAELVHGALPNYMDYITSPDEAMITFAEMRGSLTFIGHTHVTECYRNRPETDYCEQTGSPKGIIIELNPSFRYIINPGSVGQPRDGNAEASFGLYDIEARTVALRRVPYDYKRTQRKMRRAGLPAFLVDRLSQGR
jgi:diadenosine tetraphosphatase ApaH/serine/threonine PP2A family protein phosphatase